MPQNYLNVLKKTENESTAKKTKTTKTIYGIEKQTTKETADQIQQGIAKEILRFHVLANSDSEEDQKLKLEVKDRLVDYMKDILDGAEDVKETKNVSQKIGKRSVLWQNRKSRNRAILIR